MGEKIHREIIPKGYVAQGFLEAESSLRSPHTAPFSRTVVQPPPQKPVLLEDGINKVLPGFQAALTFRLEIVQTILKAIRNAILDAILDATVKPDFH